MNMQSLMTKYFEAHALAWAPSTQKSEAHRLGSVIEHINGNPEALWKALKDLAPYSRLTTWTRVTHFYAWLIEFGHAPGPNKYKQFKRTNARLFKHVYETRTPTISFEEAYKRISGIEDEATRAHASRLLLGGLRFTESLSESDSRVLGKGSKQRKVFGGEEGSQVPYHTLRRALGQVGLRPHDLRKLCATELARQGLAEADLCKVMGWSSFTTAKAYIAPLKDEAISDVFANIRAKLGAGGPANETKQTPESVQATG